MAGTGFLLDGLAPTYQIPFGPLSPTGPMDLVSVRIPDSFSAVRNVLRVRRVVISNPGAQTTPGHVNIQVGFGLGIQGTGGTAATNILAVDARGGDGDLVASVGAAVRTGDATTVVADFAGLVNVPVWVPGAVGAFTPRIYDLSTPSGKCPTVPEGATLVLRHPGSAGASGLYGCLELTCSLENRGPFATPLIPDAVYPSVAHVYFDGARLRDVQGNAWAQNGTVPQVAPSGLVPAGAGPFSDGNYYSLGSGSDVLDFAGDFSACFVLKGYSDASNPVLFSDGNYGVSGYQLGVQDASHKMSFNSAAFLLAAEAATIGSTNVVCVGFQGVNAVIKCNLGAMASAAKTGTPAGAIPARLGRSDVAGQSWPGTLYEAWFASTTPSDALFTALVSLIARKLNLAF